MDRRTIIAFVLIFLVFSGYSLVMKKFYPPAELPVEVEEQIAESEIREPSISGLAPEQAPESYSEVAGETQSASATITDVEAALRQVDAAAPARVPVSGPLYNLVIDTRGGRIVSWNGLGFDSWEGGPVQLIPESGPNNGLDALIFRGAELDLGGLVFSADKPSLSMTDGGGTESLTLRALTAGGFEVRKIYSFRPDVYGIEIDYALVANSAESNHALSLTGTPEDFRFGWNQGIAPTERVQKMELPAMRSMARIGEDVHYKKRDGLKKSVEKVEEQWSGSVHFAGLQNRYFTVVGVVPQEQGVPVEGRIKVSGEMESMSQSWTIDVPARRGVGDELAVAQLDLYVGPQVADLLKPYGQGLVETMDLGWKFFRPLSKLVLVVVEFFHRYISNYGLIIIIISVLSKLMLYPLTRSSTKSMKRMQEVQPKMKALQEKYKNDKEKLNQATMQLYKDEKVNPVAGCLPLVLQSPIFIALYQALSHTIVLRGQPFVWWITDLSQPDAIMALPFALPMLGSDLNVLPILMAGAMYFQTKFTPNAGGQQMAMMNTMMPLFMIFIFYNMPSGLVLYWLVNTLMQGYQSWSMQRGTSAGGGAQTT
jgi:YidC/Oxa1 family membrane protein insertase